MSTKMAKIKEYIELFHEHNIHIPTRTIYLGQPLYDDGGQDPGVDHVMASNFVKNMHILNAINSDEITIFLNTPGGDVIQGMAIYNTIKNSRSHVKMIVRGSVMSMGSYILQAADERIMSQDSVFMMHVGQEGHAPNHPNIVRAWVKWGEEYGIRLDDILYEKMCEKNPEFKRKKYNELVLFDTIYSAQKCVELGLADKVEEPEDALSDTV